MDPTCCMLSSHLVLPGVIGYPLNVRPRPAGSRSGTTWRLSGGDLAVLALAGLPLAVVHVLDLLPPVPGHQAEAAPLLHLSDMLFRLLHVGVDIVKALLYSVEMLPLSLQHLNGLGPGVLTLLHHLDHPPGALQTLVRHSVLLLLESLQSISHPYSLTCILL